MNTVQITKILTNDQFTKKYFTNVYARDEIPIKVKYPSCFILNTHNRSQPGEHWLAVFVDQDGVVEFFDSMGLDPSYYKLDEYFKIIAKRLKFSAKRIQSYFSDYCGIYCLFFLYWRCRGQSFEQILDNFSDSFDENDKLVEKMIKNF